MEFSESENLVRLSEKDVGITIALPSGIWITVYADGSVEAVDQNGNIKPMGRT